MPVGTLARRRSYVTENPGLPHRAGSLEPVTGLVWRRTKKTLLSELRCTLKCLSAIAEICSTWQYFWTTHLWLRAKNKLLKLAQTCSSILKWSQVYFQTILRDVFLIIYPGLLWILWLRNNKSSLIIFVCRKTRFNHLLPAQRNNLLNPVWKKQKIS